MQYHHFEVGKGRHRCARCVLPSYAHFVNLSLAVILCVQAQLLISLSLSEVEDTSLKLLRIGAITILGFEVINDVVRLARSESLPCDVLLLIRHHVGQVRNVGW
jgi:hypothetical protein